MSKIKISEDTLQKLIMESINDIFEERGINGGSLGHRLGYFAQGVRNKLRHLGSDFKAGKNKRMKDDIDYNSYGIFGDEENDVRKYSKPGAYGKERYELEVNRNQVPWGQTQKNSLIQDNPDIEPQNQETLQNQETPQNNKQQGNDKQALNNVLDISKRLNQLNKQFQEWGFQKVGNEWLYHGQRQDKASESSYDEIRNANSEYWKLIKQYAFLNEHRKRINKLISENVTKALKNNKII